MSPDNEEESGSENDTPGMSCSSLPICQSKDHGGSWLWDWVFVGARRDVEERGQKLAHLKLWIPICLIQYLPWRSPRLRSSVFCLVFYCITPHWSLCRLGQDAKLFFILCIWYPTVISGMGRKEKKCWRIGVLMSWSLKSKLDCGGKIRDPCVLLALKTSIAISWKFYFQDLKQITTSLVQSGK